MKSIAKTLTFLLAFLLFTGMCLHKPGTGIPWSQQYKLTWEDFKGQPDTPSPSKGLKP